MSRAERISPAGRVMLAVLSGAAGVIHLAMVPSHMDSSAVEGIGFAVTGWIQIGLALWVLSRPSRATLRVIMLVNVAFIAVWLISRTFGLPFGESAGHPHDVGFVDLACVGIEGALIVMAGVFLERPTLGRDWDGARLAVAAIVPVAVLALATAALASPSARDHAHSSHDDHTSDATTASAASADGHAHGVGTAGGASVDDKGLSLLSNGHQHGAAGEVPLDRATQVALSQQLNQLSFLIAKYPTIAAAEASGYRRAGPFSPGLGTHYGGLGNRNMADDTIQGVDGPMYPMLVFDGTDPDSPLAGFMFLSLKNQSNGVVDGFVGPNDHWHYHTNVCVVYRNGVIEAPFGADADINILDCRKVGGQFMSVTTNMVHVWTVPGYESPDGAFSEFNPRITCPDGTYYKVNNAKIGFRLNACKSESA